MAEQIIVPKLGMAAAEVTLTEWKAQEGARIEKGDPVLDIEAEKSSFEMTAPASGFLHILMAQGHETDVNTVVGLIAETEAEYRELSGAANAPSASPEAAAPAPLSATMPVTATADAPAGRRFITPIARRMAQEAGLDISAISGSGPNGRIQKRDVEAAIGSVAIPATTAPARVAVTPMSPPSPVAGASVSRAIRGTIPYKGMRRSIGENMMKSLAVNAPNTMSGDFDFTVMARARELLVAQADRLGVRITYADLILHAAARALRQAPLINSSLVGDEVVIWDDINIGMAVGLGEDGDKGLVVPVIRNADQLSLVDLSRKAKDLGARARAGQLLPEEMSGGTFTVSNFGSLGVSSYSTPIINPPESGIIGIGRLVKKPIVRNDGIVIAPMLPYSLTHDHRIVDGAAAEHFLRAFKQAIENTNAEIGELIVA